MLRSEPMQLCMLNIEKNFAWDVLETVGRCSCLHFIDANKASKESNSAYAKLVQRSHHALGKVKVISRQCRKHVGALASPCSVESFTRGLERELARRGMDEMAYFEAVEQALEEDVAFLDAHRKKAKEADEKCTSLLEEKYVLTKASDIVLNHLK